MAEQFVNYFTSKPIALATPINNSVTSVALSGAGASSLPTSGTYSLLVDQEVMEVTAYGGGIATVVRGTDGSIAASHLVDANVIPVQTARAQTQSQNDIIDEMAGLLESGAVIPNTSFYAQSFTVIATGEIDCSAGGTIFSPYGSSDLPTQLQLFNATGPVTFQFITGEWVVLVYNENAYPVAIETDTAGVSGLIPPGGSAWVMCSGNSGLGQAWVLQQGTFTDETTFQPSNVSPLTVNQNTAMCGQQEFTDSGSTVVLTIPLPGTDGNPIAFLSTTGLMTLDVSVRAVNQTTLDAAWWKFSWAWVVQTSGSPSPLGAAAVAGLAVGNSVVTPQAIPSGWTATVALDGGSQNVLVTVTTGTGTGEQISTSAEASWNNTQ